MSVKNEVIYRSLIPVCQDVSVVLRNEVLSAQGGLQGVYHIGDIVNDNQSWKSVKYNRSVLCIFRTEDRTLNELEFTIAL